VLPFKPHLIFQTSSDLLNSPKMAKLG